MPVNGVRLDSVAAASRVSMKAEVCVTYAIVPNSAFQGALAFSTHPGPKNALSFPTARNPRRLAEERSGCRPLPTAEPWVCDPRGGEHTQDLENPRTGKKLPGAKPGRW